MVKRVVFDTNVLISGYLWNGAARKALAERKNRGFNRQRSKWSAGENWREETPALGENGRSNLTCRPPGMKACFQRLGVILPVKDWATILPSRTTNVSVPTSYTLSAVSAVHRM